MKVIYDEALVLKNKKEYERKELLLICCLGFLLLIAGICGVLFVLGLFLDFSIFWVSIFLSIMLIAVFCYPFVNRIEIPIPNDVFYYFLQEEKFDSIKLLKTEVIEDKFEYKRTLVLHIEDENHVVTKKFINFFGGKKIVKTNLTEDSINIHTGTYYVPYSYEA